MKALGFALAIALFAACGSNSKAAPDAPPVVDAPTVDSPAAAATFTSFTIDLIVNHTSSTTEPDAFTMFSTLPDPDATTNNTAAYMSLFM